MSQITYLLNITWRVVCLNGRGRQKKTAIQKIGIKIDHIKNHPHADKDESEALQAYFGDKEIVQLMGDLSEMCDRYQTSVDLADNLDAHLALKELLDEPANEPVSEPVSTSCTPKSGKTNV